MAVDDAARLRAAGVPIALADGTKAELVFDFDALMHIEEKFGSVAAFLEATTAGVTSPMMATIAKGVAAATRHTGAPVTPSQLDPKRVREYLVALDEAFAVAWPAPAEGEGGKDSGVESGSTGPDTSTPPPSDSAGPTNGSGG